MSAWQPIETADAHVPWHQAPRCLVYGQRVGVQMGKVYRYPDGLIEGQAENFLGDWGITHWMPLPEPPK